MYCAVFVLADGTYEREFLENLPTECEIRCLEDSYSLYITNPSRAYYDNTERKPAKIINLFKIQENEND